MSHEPEDHLPEDYFDARAASARSSTAAGGNPAQPSEQPDPGAVPGSAAQPARYRASYAANYMDESPELLRWRADSLLDEMMLGGLDVSAADTSAAPATAPARPATTRPSVSHEESAPDVWRAAQSPPPNRPPASHLDAGFEPEVDSWPQPDEQPMVGRYTDVPDPREQDRRASSYPDQPHPGDERSADRTARADEMRPDSRYESNGIPPIRSEYPAPSSTRSDYAASSSTRSDYAASSSRTEPAVSRREQFQLDEIGVRPPRLEPDKPAPDVTPRPLESVRSGDARGEATGGSGQGDRLYDLEQKYEQLRREQESTIRPVPPKTPVASTTPDPSDTDPWPDPGQKWLEQDFGATPEPEIEPGSVDYAGYHTPRYEEPDSPVRFDQAGFVNAMSVTGGKKRRSTLLPRMSEVSADDLQQEITKLHAELAELLPVGHEAAERARHLLDKAYSILQSDPMRSAEVEYYMQQVRTIVRRQSQARDWSNLYRDRLHVYLLSWASFAAVVLMARFVFQIEIEAWLIGSLGRNPNGAVVHHFAAWLGTGLAGALGGALGALYTMRQHAKNSQYNFFDRKYGLRGLILPIIGLIVGWIGYLIFGLLFAVFGISPSANIVAGTLPAMAAFAFGFSQESIYGTRS